MKKKDIYKFISDKNIPFEQLAKNIKIEDFVGGINIIDKEKKLNYGVNVRLSRESDITIYPFNYNNNNFNAEEIAERVTRGYKLPDFLYQFGLQEIIFRVDFNKIMDNSGEDIINIIEIEDKRIEKNPFVSNGYRFNEIGKNGNTLIDDFFKKSTHSFLHENLLGLFSPISSPPSSISAYVWVRGEDPDVSTSDGRFLTHILAISDDSNKFYNFIENTRMNFMEFVIMLKSRKLYDADVIQRKEAIKSAKAAIMSRNMSHNLGSHVLSYLKMHLGSVSNILRDHVLSTLLESENLNTLRNHALVANELTLPFLVGIGRFISYLQERQDFIATISTDFVPFYSSVNFKDFIFDELNCDKRYERHPKRTNLKTDNILFGNIARSEGLGRQTSPTKGDSTLHDIILKFRTAFDGSPIPPQKPQKEVQNGIKNIAARELEEMRQYELSLPGGIIGRQAIFSIIENVIRNAAKHGNWRNQGLLELTIDIFSKEEIMSPVKEVYTKRLHDDRATEESLSLQEVLKTFYCSNERSADDYYFITLTDNLDFSSKSLIQIRKALIEGYIDEDGRMINTNKGIKEMRISAAWLRSIDDDIALSPFNESNYRIEGETSWMDNNCPWGKMPPVLYARRSKNIATGASNLQYIFCVMRPKKVAFISHSFKDIKTQNPQKASLFQMHDWDLLTPAEYIYRKNKNYDFVIYDDTINYGNKKLDDGGLKEVKRSSSKRFFTLSELNKSYNEFKDIKNGTNCDEIDLKNAYHLLYGFLSGLNQTDSIFIIDDKATTNLNNSEEHHFSRIIPYKTYPDGEKVKYRYQYHLEDKSQFQQYVIMKDPNHEIYFFSEGISGDNSTDRLVRNEPKTELWFYKHLHAMKQKVAIFDERIFSKVTGLDESDFMSSETFWGRDLNADKEYIKALLDENEIDKMKIDSFSLLESLNNFMKLKGIKLPKISNLITVDSKNYLGATYEYKNLHVFSLIQSIENPERFNLYGILINKDKPAFSQCVRYATLRWKRDKKRLIIENDEQRKTNWMIFHSLSIHQGLLDKMYNAFGIEKNDTEAKENLTKDFYEHFIIDAHAQEISFDDEKGYTHYFLPGMTIHSGRSKPSQEDMPQQLPFIPYSALEQAVLDCKCSIVDLLDSARYE